MLDHPALREQIITYIGNKRKLLFFIQRGIEEILREEGKGPANPRGDAEGEPLRFLDAFAGSGVVSRMARLLGFRVHANDLEQYSAPLINPFLTIDPAEAESLFAPVAGSLGLSPSGASYSRHGELPFDVPAPSYDAVLDYLNGLTEPVSDENRYFALHYAPQNTANADPARERLFYTRENGLKIDAILEALRGPAFDLDAAREAVLASLLHQMSVHVNTSGVMKGYHNGWGGRGKDALGRIMAPIALASLPFIGGPKGTVSTRPAEELFTEGRLPEQDIIYADPPYNIHQYGANYHLLNTAILGDRYDPGPVLHGSRAGIRRDHNRSPFCRSVRDEESGLRECEAAFERFVRRIRGRYLLVSYNTDGLIPPQKMAKILSQGGKNRVTATVQEHIKFKGGKNTQSSLRTREILYRVDLDRRGTGVELDGIVALLAREERLGRLKDSYIDPKALPWKLEQLKSGEILCRRDGVPLLRLRRDFRLLEVFPAGMEETVLDAIEAGRIEKLRLMERYVDEGMVPEAIDLLRSFKIRKYRKELLHFAAKIDTLAPEGERERLRRMLDSYGIRLARRS